MNHEGLKCVHFGRSLDEATEILSLVALQVATPCLLRQPPVIRRAWGGHGKTLKSPHQGFFLHQMDKFQITVELLEGFMVW
jgi:hypothetical protein